ncbi:MAG: MerR family transcriptional regulator [Ancrocorticia sp.]|jgi:DNA-binding transcriptional MerR regulator|nr:MerR family transcriptional regulator [Ancrocorticia sp.]MCI2178168.1 MerR family transcriptional regulator [Ancrocorticia sp.]
MRSDEGALRTVGEVAELLGISVRTLHHWEARGLVSPAERTWSNYRLYSNDDVARLQQIMIYRATGMHLDAIAELLNNDADPVAHLQRQRHLLMTKENELHLMVHAVDMLLEDAMSTKKLSVEAVAEILGDASFPAYQVEAEEKWGGTEDWVNSARNAEGMTRGDWEDFAEKSRALEAALVDAMNRGVKPGSVEANELAEAHRSLYSQFYPVTYAKHVLLASGYVSDPRFTAYYDARGEGLATWLKEIIDANAVAHGIDPENASWE